MLTQNRLQMAKTKKIANTIYQTYSLDQRSSFEAFRWRGSYFQKLRKLQKLTQLSQKRAQHTSLTFIVLIKPLLSSKFPPIPFFHVTNVRNTIVVLEAELGVHFATVSLPDGDTWL